MSEKNSEGSNKLPIPPDKMLSSESAPSDEKNSAQVISQENKPHEVRKYVNFRISRIFWFNTKIICFFLFASGTS